MLGRTRTRADSNSGVPCGCFQTSNASREISPLGSCRASMALIIWFRNPSAPAPVGSASILRKDCRCGACAGATAWLTRLTPRPTIWVMCRNRACSTYWSSSVSVAGVREAAGAPGICALDLEEATGAWLRTSRMGPGGRSSSALVASTSTFPEASWRSNFTFWMSVATCFHSPPPSDSLCHSSTTTLKR